MQSKVELFKKVLKLIIKKKHGGKKYDKKKINNLTQEYTKATKNCMYSCSNYNHQQLGTKLLFLTAITANNILYNKESKNINVVFFLYIID